MFPTRYYARRYFPAGYFPPSGETPGAGSTLRLVAIPGGTRQQFRAMLFTQPFTGSWGTAVVVTVTDGRIEFTVPNQRLEFTTASRRLEFTIADQRLEFTASKP